MLSSAPCKEPLEGTRSNFHPNTTPSLPALLLQHQSSKSLETTQTGNQGARGFQSKRVAFPLISKSCPIADHPPEPLPDTPGFPQCQSQPLTCLHTRTCTHTHMLTSRVRAAFYRTLLSPLSLPSSPPSSKGGKGFPGFPISHSTLPSPPPKPAHAPLPPPALPPSHP